MSRLGLLVAIMLVIGADAALADESAGRYRIVTAPLDLAGEPQPSTLLIDTATGRTWLAVRDDKGRPRWRGIEFAGGSQALAELPPDGPSPRTETATGTRP